MDIEYFVSDIKNANVKEYIEESIKSYNSGSFRASITYIWLAVFMDINQKIEQLSVLGEQEAIAIINKIEKIRKDNNIQEMLSFERDILTIAKEKFSLFDDITMVDLKRIQEDRNRSVHPLLSYEGLLYKPSAEQARTHLINAYTKLLNEPNVYGKSAINRLFELIYSTIFPIDYLKAKIVLESSYLKSPKDSLLNNFTIAMLKQYLKEPLEFRRKIAIENTLKYLFEKKRGNIENIIGNKLPTIINFANNNELLKILKLILLDNYFYNLFDDAQKILINNFVMHCPSGNLDMLDELAKIPDIGTFAETRIKNTDRQELFEYIDEIPWAIPKSIRKAMTNEYIKSINFDLANGFARVIIAAIPEMEKDELNELIIGIGKNGQISNSFQAESVLRKINNTKKYKDDEFLTIIKENDLENKL
jgi:hypothetical protein